MSNPYNAPAAEMSEQHLTGTYDPQLFEISGRIGRLRYLAYSLVSGILGMVVLCVGAAIGAIIGPKAMMALMFLLWIPFFAAGFVLSRRRFNDMDRSGWFSLLLFVPVVGFFVYLWLVFGPGDEESNDFGLPPSKNTTAIVIGALCIPVLVMLIGIVAAISIPAYQDYVNKAKAMQMQNAPAPALPDASQ